MPPKQNLSPGSGSLFVTSVLAGQQNIAKFSHLLGPPRSESSPQSTSTPSSKYSQFAKGKRINSDYGISTLIVKTEQNWTTLKKLQLDRNTEFKKLTSCCKLKIISLFQMDINIANISPQRTKTVCMVIAIKKENCPYRPSYISK